MILRSSVRIPILPVQALAQERRLAGVCNPDTTILPRPLQERQHRLVSERETCLVEQVHQATLGRPEGIIIPVRSPRPLVLELVRAPVLVLDNRAAVDFALRPHIEDFQAIHGNMRIQNHNTGADLAQLGQKPQEIRSIDVIERSCRENCISAYPPE